MFLTEGRHPTRLSNTFANGSLKVHISRGAKIASLIYFINKQTCVLRNPMNYNKASVADHLPHTEPPNIILLMKQADVITMQHYSTSII
jgi:hypothetical protein